MTEQFANNASSTLNGGINNSTTAVVVTNGTVFSQSGTFRVIVDSEIMIVSAISGNVLTVARGQEGTSAVSHLSGATITQIVTSGALAQFKLDTSVGVLHSGFGNPNTFPSFVQGTNVGANGSIPKPTTANTVTAGNLLLVFQQTETNGSASTTAPTDNIGTSYSSVLSLTTGTSGSQVFGTVFLGIAPSSAIVTVTPGTTSTLWDRTTIAEYKNATTTVDSTNSLTGATATINVTPTVANSLIVGIVGAFVSAGSFTAGANLTSNVVGTGADSTFVESGLSTSGGTFAVAYSGTTNAGNIFLALAIHPATVSAAVGQDGDFYIDTLNKKLYGPRTSGVYNLIGTLT